MNNKNSSVAVFIDVENIHYSTLNNYSETPNWSNIVDLCRNYGRIASIQAFGDWIHLAKEVPEIQNNGIQPVFVPLSQDGKSSLDCYLTVSAMKLFFQNDSIDTLILASGDRDYIPLISELKALGKKIYILAVAESLSKNLTKIADGIISYEANFNSLGNVSNNKETAGKDFSKFIVDTVKELEEYSLNERWVNLATIGSSLKRKDQDFSHRKLGYKKLVEFLADIKDIELKYDNFEKTMALARTCSSCKNEKLNVLQKGTILSLKESYGFIKPTQGGENIFFHSSNLVKTKIREIKVGDIVSYSIINTERCVNAENIKVEQQ